MPVVLLTRACPIPAISLLWIYHLFVNRHAICCAFCSLLSSVPLYAVVFKSNPNISLYKKLLYNSIVTSQRKDFRGFNSPSPSQRDGSDRICPLRV
jgi:hypothetical protein